MRTVRLLRQPDCFVETKSSLVSPAQNTIKCFDPDRRGKIGIHSYLDEIPIADAVEQFAEAWVARTEMEYGHGDKTANGIQTGRGEYRCAFRSYVVPKIFL